MLETRLILARLKMLQGVKKLTVSDFYDMSDEIIIHGCNKYDNFEWIGFVDRDGNEYRDDVLKIKRTGKRYRVDDDGIVIEIE